MIGRGHSRLGWLAIIAVTLTAAGCGRASDDASQYPAVTEYLTLDLARLDNYANPDLPAPYRDPDVIALDRDRPPISDAVATLGRVLFFDAHVSVNDRIACASCHRPELGFTDSLPASVGHDGVTRAPFRAMRLANARWYNGPGFLWNRRATTLEEQATQPIVHPIEMGWDASHGGLDSLRQKLQRLPYYPELFAFAFGNPEITEARLRSALAQYVRSIVAVKSRWDIGYLVNYDPSIPDKGLLRDVPGLTPEENLGRSLFLRSREAGGFGCGSCHVPPTFSLSADARNNGLDANETVIFKAPSLKNVAITGPYMHDGRFSRLDLVVAFYDGFPQHGPALDPRFLTAEGHQVKLNMSAAQRDAVVAFLATLTDTTMRHDPRYQSPFR